MNITYIIIACILSLLPFFIKPVNKFFNHFITIFHEIGHGFSALIFGGKIQSIRIHSDGSGDTTSSHALTNSYPFARIITLLSGYSFPITTGGLLVLFGFINPSIGFWLTTIILVVSLLFMRNFFGFFVLIIFSSIVAIPFIFIPLALPYFLIGLGIFLFIGGVKDLWLISQAEFTKRSSGSSDFTLMKEELHITEKFGVILEIIFVILLLAACAFLYIIFVQM